MATRGNLVQVKSFQIAASSSGSIVEGAISVAFRCDAGTATINGNVTLTSGGSSIYNFEPFHEEARYPAISYSTGGTGTLTIVEVR